MDNSGLQQIILKCPDPRVKSLISGRAALLSLSTSANRHFSFKTWCLNPMAGAHGEVRARCDLHCYECRFAAACSEPPVGAFFVRFSLPLPNVNTEKSLLQKNSSDGKVQLYQSNYTGSTGKNSHVDKPIKKIKIEAASNQKINIFSLPKLRQI